MLEIFKLNNMNHGLNIGQKLFFNDDALPFDVKAVSERYAVVTRKLNKRKDAELIHDRVRMGAYYSFTDAYRNLRDCPIYSIIDFKENERSTDNLVFGVFDYFNEKDCKKAIKWMESGKIELSQRRKADLSINWEKTSA